ncbi:MAG: dienelactone hydrolase family protein [Nitriliruptorales bacterium]|nr:dienelactone hydrolase family protein [Nitriliruptorales bacterium]
MRPFEWLLMVGTTAALGVLAPWSWQVRGRWRWRLGYATIGVAAAGLLLHVFLEGARWQLTIVYVTLVLLVLAALRHPLRSLPPPAEASLTGPVARAFAATTALAVVLSGATAWALPVPTLEPPVGPHHVGTRTFALTDASRPEVWTETPDDVREFPVQVWYPTAVADGRRAPLTTRADVLSEAAASWLGLPDFTLSHLSLVETSAVANAPLASPTAAPWPVVIYSHGWGGFRSQHLSLMERLAANGHVVLAIDHTHAALASVFPDGHAFPINRETLPAEPAEAYAAASIVLIETYARDIQFLIEELRSDRLPIPLSATELDVERIALVGHSAGGGAAMLACSRTSSCATVVGLDPWVDPLPDDVISAGLAVPLVTLRTAEWMEEPNDDNLRRIHASSADQRLLHVAGAVHRDFTMASDLTPFAQQVGLTGATGGVRVREIAEELVLDTLARVLRDAGPSQRTWPEVQEG